MFRIIQENCDSFSLNAPSPAFCHLPLGKPKQSLRALRTVVLSLKILGSWPGKGESFCFRLNIWSGIVFLYLHTYIIHMTCNWLSQLDGEVGLFSIFDNLSNIIRTSVTAISFDLLFHRHQYISRCLNRLDIFPTLISDGGLQKVQPWIKVQAAGGWIFVAIQVGLATWSVITIDIQTYFDWYFYGARKESVHPVVARVLMSIDWGLYVIFLLSNECFIKVYYVSICLLLRRRIQDYNKYVEELHRRYQSIGGFQLQELYQLHTNLTTVVVEMDHNFSVSVFFWYTSIVINVCVKIQSVVSGFQEGDFSNFSYVLIDIAYYSITFLIVSLVASDVAEKGHAAVTTVHKMTSAAQLSDWNVHQQAQLLLSKLGTSTMGLTGWNCFVINKSFILTIVGSVVTYTIILLQMTQMSPTA